MSNDIRIATSAKNNKQIFIFNPALSCEGTEQHRNTDQNTKKDGTHAHGKLQITLKDIENTENSAH